MKDLENKIIYQIYPKSFKDTTGNGYGDIQGIISKLDYLKELGVDYLWLSPCVKSPQKDNGYDVADYLTIEPLFGTNDDYDMFIKEAKKRGMKVMMDLVLNHTSDQHEWFKKAVAGDPKYYDYYIWRDEPNEIGSYFSGNAWTYHEKVGKYYFRQFDVSQPDLNWENPEVREEVRKIVQYWIDKGVEGFRLDVIDLIGKEPDKLITSKGPNFVKYLSELQQSTFKDKLLTVGECWGSTLDEQYQMCSEKTLTQAFHFHQFSVNQVDGNKWHRKELDMDQLCDVFNTWQNEYKGIEAVVMNSHDAPRLPSIWFNDKQYRKESAKLAVSVFGMLHGNLYIYQGEEIGMTNTGWTDLDKYKDVETLNVYHDIIGEGYSHDETMKKIAFTSRDNARTPMHWDSTTNGGFTSGTPWIDVVDNYNEVNVEDDLKSDDSVYKYYQELLKYRKANYDKLKQPASFINKDGVYFMKKPNLEVIANFTEDTKDIEIKGTVVMSNYKEVTNILKPYQVVIIEK